MSSSIMFIGDVHFSETPPRSRTESYASDVISKIEFCFRKAAEFDCKTIVFLGDLFHRKVVGTDSLYSFMNCLRVIKRRYPSTNIFTIFGNHDMYYGKKDYKKTSLGVVFASGLIQHLDYYIVPDDKYPVALMGFDYSPSPLKLKQKQLQVLKSMECPTVCVAHAYLRSASRTFSSHDIVPVEDFAEYFDFMVLGHDHNSYKPVHLHGVEIHRPGALVRGAYNDINLKRDVNILMLRHGPKGITWRYFKVPVRPPQEVFTEATAIRKKTRYRIKQLTEALMEDMVSGSSDIEEMLRDVCMKLSREGVDGDKVFRVCYNYLLEHGVLDA